MDDSIILLLVLQWKITGNSIGGLLKIGLTTSENFLKSPHNCCLRNTLWNLRHHQYSSHNFLHQEKLILVLLYHMYISLISKLMISFLILWIDLSIKPAYLSFFPRESLQCEIHSQYSHTVPYLFPHQ